MNPRSKHLLELELKKSSRRLIEALDIKQSFPVASPISSIRRSWCKVAAGGLPPSEVGVCRCSADSSDSALCKDVPAVTQVEKGKKVGWTRKPWARSQDFINRFWSTK